MQFLIVATVLKVFRKSVSSWSESIRLLDFNGFRHFKRLCLVITDRLTMISNHLELFSVLVGTNERLFSKGSFVSATSGFLCDGGSCRSCKYFVSDIVLYSRGGLNARDRLASLVEGAAETSSVLNLKTLDVFF